MLNVGDRVIYSKYGNAPVQTTVRKVTKAGWIRLYAPETNEMFKPSQHEKKCYYANVRNQRAAVVFPFSQEKFDELLIRYNQIQANKKAKRQKEQQRQVDLLAERQRELDEVQALLNADLDSCTLHKTILPDGSRLRTMQLPVQADLTARKGDFEVLVARLKDVEEMNWETGVMESKVELHLTSCNGQSCSWPSYSTTRHDTDEEALWEAVRRIYHNW